MKRRATYIPVPTPEPTNAFMRTMRFLDRMVTEMSLQKEAYGR